MNITEQTPITNKKHQQVMDLLATGASAKDVSRHTGFSIPNIYVIARKYNHQFSSYTNEGEKLPRPRVSPEVVALADWLHTTHREALRLYHAATDIGSMPTPCAAITRLAKIKVTPKRHANTQMILTPMRLAVSVFPIPFILDYDTGKMIRLTWVELLKVVWNPLKYVEETGLRRVEK